MAKKAKQDSTLDNSVAGTTTLTEVLPIIQLGKVARLINFGGYDPVGSDGIGGIISLQWGSGTTWQTIRAGGYGSFDFNWEKGIDFTGDGTKRFRIVRQNRSSTAKVMLAWANIRFSE
jgi:hypothetical protein